jgi:VanZ family protein
MVFTVKEKDIKVIKLAAPIMWASIIFYLSSIPSLSSGLGVWDLYLRKAAHVTEYFILTLLIFFNLDVIDRKKRIIGLSIAVLYAVSDEYHQSFVPGRNMAFSDMAWDWIGCMLCYLWIMVFRVNKKKNNEI